MSRRPTVASNAIALSDLAQRVPGDRTRGLKSTSGCPGSRGRRRASRRAIDGCSSIWKKPTASAAIFPPMMNAVIALRGARATGSDPLRPVRLDRLAELEIEEHDSSAAPALPLAGLGHGDRHDRPGGRRPAADNHPALSMLSRWLLNGRFSAAGRLASDAPGIEPGGWHFQFRNEFYPDIDDTAMVLMALLQVGVADRPEIGVQPCAAGVDWLLAHAEPRRRLGGLRRGHRQRGR